MPHAESALDALGRNLIDGFDPRQLRQCNLGEVEKLASYNLKAFFPESSALKLCTHERHQAFQTRGNRISAKKRPKPCCYPFRMSIARKDRFEHYPVSPLSAFPNKKSAVFAVCPRQRTGCIFQLCRLAYGACASFHVSFLWTIQGIPFHPLRECPTLGAHDRYDRRMGLRMGRGIPNPSRGCRV